MSDLKIFTENIEGKALNQVYEIIKQPAFNNSKIRIMPDVHSGAGCVIGFTSKVSDKIIPNIVGVDIGCGVRVLKFDKNINIDLEKLDNFIKDEIPSGLKVNSKIQGDVNLIKDLICYKDLIHIERLELSLSSLGGGNHFIEIDKDDLGYKYLVIHTGSRNLGLQVAKIYQKKAIEYCNHIGDKEIKETISLLKSQGRQSEIEKEVLNIRNKYQINSIPRELCFLDGEEKNNYLHDMKICQAFAKLNRENISRKICRFLKIQPIEEFESVHNYISDDNMIRKGAISAKKGEKLIIPLNMRDGSIIGIGKGNDDWNQSAPHGAGRLLSRSEAKSTLKLEDFQNSMKDIFTTTVNSSTIDESAMAYKPADEIINKIKDTVDIINIIKPIYNFKAAE